MTRVLAPTPHKWLGAVPSSWSIVPFRRAFRESAELNGENPVGSMLSVSGYRGVEVKDYAFESQVRTPDLLENYRVLRPGQLAVNTMWLNYGGLGFSGYLGHMSPAYRAYDLVIDAHRPFLNYLLRSATYIKGYTGHLRGIRPNSLQMPRNDLMNWPVLLPPRQEQVAIADFLDRETAKIDALIEKQLRLAHAGLAREDALISRRVIGRDLVQSGSSEPWLNLLQRGWGVTRLGYQFDVTLGKMLDDGKQAPEDSEVVPYLRAANIRSNCLDLDDVNQMPFTPHERRRLSLVRGDLLVVEGGMVGRSHLLRDDLPGLSFQKTLNRVRSRGFGSTHYLHYVLRWLKAAGVIDLICDGSTFMHLTAEKLRALKVPWPPPAEQACIAHELDEALTGSQVLLGKIDESIALAQERRAALITAAVTGQMEVGGAA